MNIQNIVNTLLSNGFTQETLAAELGRAGVKTDQSTISRMATSATYKTKSDKVLALLDIYNKAAAENASTVSI